MDGKGKEGISRGGVYSLHGSQRGGQVYGDHGGNGGEAQQGKLQECVVLADGGGVNFGRRKGEVPIPGERLWRRKRYPPVVDGGNTQAHITAEDGSCEPHLRWRNVV